MRKAKAKAKTSEQVEAMQRKAVRFAENVLEDDDLADELDALSVQEYAERKHLTIANPARREKPQLASTGTKKELQDSLDEVGNQIMEMLDPSLTRKEIVERLQELDSFVNGDDEEDEEDDSAAEDDDEEEQ